MDSSNQGRIVGGIKEMSKIYIIMGKSATGKDTLYKKMIESKELDFKTVILYTTRPIRAGETNGVEYYFVDEKQLKEFQKSNKIIEYRAYNTIHGLWSYFTVDDGQIDLTDNNYLMIGTLEAYEQVKNYYGKGNIIPIYIEVDDGIRLTRALAREKEQEIPKYAELCRRYLADEIDFSEKNILEQGIERRYNNEDVHTCVKQIIDDIKNM